MGRCGFIEADVVKITPKISRFARLTFHVFQAPTQTRLHFFVMPLLLQKVSEKSFLNLLFVVLTTKSGTIELVSVANTTPSTGETIMTFLTANTSVLARVQALYPMVEFSLQPYRSGKAVFYSFSAVVNSWTGKIMSPSELEESLIGAALNG